MALSVGDRIRYVRMNLVGVNGAEMTQPEFAELAGLRRGQRAVINWEKNRHAPRAKAARLIADATPYAPEVFQRHVDAAQQLELRQQLTALVARVAALEAEGKPPQSGAASDQLPRASP